MKIAFFACVRRSARLASHSSGPMFTFSTEGEVDAMAQMARLEVEWLETRDAPAALTLSLGVTTAGQVGVAKDGAVVAGEDTPMPNYDEDRDEGIYDEHGDEKEDT